MEEHGWRDLKPGQSDLFQLDARACLDLHHEYTAAKGHEGGVRNYMYLYVEMWDKSGPEGAYVKDGQSGAEHTSAIPDPMLLLRQGMLPPTATYRGSWTFSADTYADLLSYKVVRPYHRYWVQLDVTRIKACQYSKTTQCLNEVNWQSKVYNVDYWLQQNLRYYFKASCSMEKPCPAPQGPTSNPCSGKGVCVNGECRCQDGWGGEGCNDRLTKLAVGQVAHGKLDVNQWEYFSYEVGEKALTVGEHLIVSMERSSGDPVVLLKEASQGSVPGGLPTILDYSDFADTKSFKNRYNYHQRSVEVMKPGKYFIGVYNNNLYIQEPAKYKVQVRVNPPEEGACLDDCGVQKKRGTCIRNLYGPDTCSCTPGWGGEYCQGIVYQLEINSAVENHLSRGEVQFYQIYIPPATDILDAANIQVDFFKETGHPALLAKKGGFPSLTDNDFDFIFNPDAKGDYSHVTINRQDMSDGLYHFAVFNMDYEQHEECTYRLRLSLSSDMSIIYGPYMTVILGVLVCIFLLLLSGICWRVALRGANNNNESTTGIILSTLGGLRPFGNSNQAAENRGLSQELIDSMPATCYQCTAQEGGPAGAEDEEPTCSVCLCEFEEGDLVRTIPMCRHEFHVKCLDAWLTNNATCPMCRLNITQEALGHHQVEIPTLPGSPDDRDSDDGEESASRPYGGGTGGGNLTPPRTPQMIELANLNTPTA